MIRVHECGETLRVDTTFGSFAFSPVGPVRVDRLRAVADALNEAVMWHNEASAPRECTPKEGLLALTAEK